ncbi:MAG: bifunctional 5,10-methylene-tetrahydrofolate dehydrogenase/5,10-methylene-tetrahydrofolate cyclohydrolase, partial [Oscillospiraceae bacterium]|nr:bifunctional 5,10-methylene-tetrahydrofolate dehydrogenase/5,10-methylene-tetrahydrofolate cyclohydrolase [Oscillospiraceae bacterium]
MATIIDGKKIAAEVRAELKEKTEKMVAETKRRPALAVILVGEDPASQVYVRNKAKACEEIGIASEVVTLAADITQEM